MNGIMGLWKKSETIGNGKISKEFVISQYVPVMVLFMSVFLPGLDK